MEAKLKPGSIVVLHSFVYMRMFLYLKNRLNLSNDD